MIFLVGIGVFAANGWLPRTESLTGKKTGWFGKELPENASSTWNPFSEPLPSSTPQLSKEYIYAGSRLLAVEDANAGGGGATPTPTPAIEGDVLDAQGTPAGDGQVLANDLQAIRNIILGNSPQPDPGSHYQRTDIAEYPCGTAGAINSGDVTVVRQFILGSLQHHSCLRPD